MKTEIQGFHKLNLFVAISLGIIILLLSLTLVWTDFQISSNRKFATEASRIQDQLRHKISSGQSALDSIISLFTAMPYTDAEGFRIVSDQFINKSPFISSLAYFHYTDASQRSFFEQQMKQRGYAGFNIKQKANPDHFIRADKRDDYLPLMFIEPFSVQHAIFLGFDINSEKLLSPVINQSIETNSPTGSLSDETVLQSLSEYWIFSPLYAGKTPQSKKAFLRQDLRGLVAVGIELSELINSVDLPDNSSIDILNPFELNRVIASSGQINHSNSIALLSHSITLDESLCPLLIHINKSINISEIPLTGFVFALILSTIITFLLIYVARINSLRNTELITLNNEISRQVKLKTSDLELAKTDLENSINSLKNSEKKYRSLIETTSEGFWIIDLNCHIQDINESLCKMLQFSRNFLLGTSIFDYVTDENKSFLQQQTSQLQTTDQHQYDISLVSKNGSQIPVIFETTTLKNISGKVIGAFAFIIDISERKQAEKELQLAASVFTHASEGIIITDAQGNILDVNTSFSRITGYSHAEVIGKNPRFLKSGHQDKNYYQTMWKELLNKGSWYGEVWNRRKTGEVYAQMLSINMVCDDSDTPQHFVGLFSDITTQKAHQKQLEHIAHYDALTNLPNRLLFSDRLMQAMKQENRRDLQLAVAYLDLDGFKDINDTYGHDIGDQLLINLASRFKEILRIGDSISRLGGDEFVAVLIDLTSRNDCLPLLKRLLSAADQPIYINNQALQVSASIGVTFYPQTDSINADQLLRQADQAMYQAKLAGKNRFKLFDTHEDQSIRTHHETLERIQQAIRNHEFILFYQPKVNMSTGEVFGVEALIRWQHPERGLLPPMEFLPFIEDDPIAIDLGYWVIETALSQLSKWHQSGLKLSASVNISSQHIQAPEFTERLQSLLNKFPMVDNHFFELEILETSALEDVGSVSQVILSCQKFGVKFALDDFGTGYSSLTYLRRLPTETLKIDRSFVSDMLFNIEDLAILEGVLDLSKAFRRQVIAEGVETIEHGVLLLQLGCELAQGFGISRPVSAEKLSEWLSQWKPDVSWTKICPVNPNDRPLLYAGIEHRTWMLAVEHYIEKSVEKNVPITSQISTKDQFSRWINDDVIKRHTQSPGYHSILSLHKEIHQFGIELCTSVQNDKTIASAGLKKLHTMSNTMLTQLNTLLNEQYND